MHLVPFDTNTICSLGVRSHLSLQTTYVIFGRRGSGKTTIRLQVKLRACLQLRWCCRSAHMVLAGVSCRDTCEIR